MSIQVIREQRPGLYCVELRTGKWDEMVRWYREMLGLKVLVRVVDDGYALLEAGETRIALISRESPGPLTARWSLGFEVDNLDRVSQRLVEGGWEVSHPDRTAEGFREIVTLDPDGNRLRLFAWPEMT
ncbi:MAG TPA: VOC family protein [Pirellulales bacterium]|jgi:catechol 2,3-dioxygenase-like lactoylglutathione lyase family enzyme|nr:VOC family protein [Pirellulales bacterium]